MMNFINNAFDCICPFLSIGREEAVECQKNCMLRNPDTNECSLTSLESLGHKSQEHDS